MYGIEFKSISYCTYCPPAAPSSPSEACEITEQLSLPGSEQTRSGLTNLHFCQLLPEALPYLSLHYSRWASGGGKKKHKTFHVLFSSALQFVTEGVECPIVMPLKVRK